MIKTDPSPLTSRIQLVAAAILFSTGGAAVKACTLTSWQIAGFRSAVAALSIFFMLPASRRHWNWRTLAVGAFYACMLISFVNANKLTTAASSIYLQATAPFYVLLLAPWLLKERVRSRDIAFMLAMALGMLLLFTGREAATATAPNPFLGNIYGASSGLLWGCTLMGLRWLGRGKSSENSAAPAVFLGNIIAFVVCLPAALPVGQSRPIDWLLIVGLGVFQIGLAYVFLTWGIQRVPVLDASLLLLVEPMLNPILAWLVHGESPGVWSIAGGSVILISTILKTWLDRRPAGFAVR